MPLPEERRKQLDGIVQQMVANKESDSNVQLVVNDFISKYQKESVAQQPAAQKKPVIDRVLETGFEAEKGIAKGVGSTLHGAGRLVQGIGMALLPKSLEPKDPLFKKEKPAILKPTNTAQKIGFGAEQIAEFLIPSSKIVQAQQGLTGAIKGTGVASKLARTAVKVGTDVAATGAISAAQQGEVNDDVKTTMLVSGVFSTAGSIASGVKGSLKPVGQKIQQVVIKPHAADYRDGFKIDNVNKYNVGGSLEETVAKTNVRLNGLSRELRNKVKGSNALLDMNTVLRETENALTKDKTLTFGSNKGIARQIQALKDEMDDALPKGKVVDLWEATQIKRGAGTKGSWAYGRTDPDADATEKVYNTFYNILKTKINASAPAEVQQINKEISELIPISNAALRRLPVDQRNQVISLTDGIGLFASMFDPKALAVLGAQRLSKSGKFGQFLVNVASKTPKSSVGKRIFGQ